MAQDTLALLKRTMPLSTYVERFAKLGRRTGHKAMAFCPFHENKNTPAMSIDDSKGLWKCFGCGVGGSIIDFWMLHHGMNPKDSGSFGEAIEGLASELGVALPERQQSNEIGTRRIKEALKAVAEEASLHLLDDRDPESRAARRYLRRERGMELHIAETWQLGVLPEGDAATRFILESVEGDKQAATEGGILAKRQSDGRLWCPFQGRLLFPIVDGTGSVVGFGGRTVPGVEAYGPGKYINPAENRVYSKSKVLYGMDLLKRETKRAVIVEGYLDVIAVSETPGAGIGLACCGTSLTTGQVALVEGVEEVVTLFDGDVAGTKALSSAYWMANKLGDRVSATLLEGGTDPWELAFGNPEGEVAPQPERLVELVTTRAKPLLEAAVEARSHISGSDQELDRWVGATIATLSRTDHKDIVIRTAAALRKQSVSTYGRELVNQSIGSRVTIDEQQLKDAGACPLDTNMQSLLRRILQMPEWERESVLASVHEWSEETDNALRTWLPISSELDLAAFKRVAVGEIEEHQQREVDRAIAALLPEDSSPVEDISTPLRNMITLMAHDARSVCGEMGTPPSLTQQLLALRRINGSSRDAAKQPTVLTYLLDLAIDLDGFHRNSERASA